MKLTCPANTHHTEFEVSAHVAQTWVVDTNGQYVEVVDECVDVIHYPDAQDYYTCAQCGSEAVKES